MESNGTFLNVTHYRVLGRIGVGGMGAVYLAPNTKLDRHVAIKPGNITLRPEDRSVRRSLA